MFDGVVELEFAIWVSIYDTGPFKPVINFGSYRLIIWPLDWSFFFNFLPVFNE